MMRFGYLSKVGYAFDHGSYTIYKMLLHLLCTLKIWLMIFPP